MDGVCLAIKCSFWVDNVLLEEVEGLMKFRDQESAREIDKFPIEEGDIEGANNDGTYMGRPVNKEHCEITISIEEMDVGE